MRATSLLWIEYPTADGLVARIEVSRDIAEALAAAEDGGQPEATTFTDLAGKRRRRDDRRGLDPNAIDEATGKRRVAQRREATGNPWEGPRFSFSLLLGEGRPNWHGGEAIDERGNCGLCHGLKLPTFCYCLSCDRSGRDNVIPTPGEQKRRRAHKRGKLKGGLSGKR